MKRLAILAIAACFALPSAAQEPGSEWGKTPEEQAANRQAVTIMRHLVNTKDWGNATYYLQKLMKEAPTGHATIYETGINMYLQRARTATDPAQKLVMADSLILMYDKYIATFLSMDSFVATYPDIPSRIWNNRATHTREFWGDDKARIFKAFREGVEKVGDTTPALLVAYFHEITGAYMAKELSVEEYLNEYSVMEQKLETIEGSEEQQAQLQKLFVDSGAANCEVIEQFFGAKINETPDDVDLLDRTLALLNRGKCTGDFYMSVAEKYYKVKPTAETAQIIAANYKAKGDNATASRYLEEAITLADTPDKKLGLMLSIAVSELDSKNFATAYRYAHQAAEIKSGDATAQFLMAAATTGGARACGDASMIRGAYWLAYDRMLEARRLATADPEANAELKSSIESYLSSIVSAFPTAEQLFLDNIAEGSAFTVSCGWISGRTTVRKR